jgi:hypothetical protein
MQRTVLKMRSVLYRPLMLDPELTPKGSKEHLGEAEAEVLKGLTNVGHC